MKIFISKAIIAIVVGLPLSGALAEGNSADDGKKLYEANCVVCHGSNGAGDGVAASALNPKPRNFHHETFKKGDSKEEIFKTISSGLGSGMPAFSQLSEAQRWDLANYVRLLRSKN